MQEETPPLGKGDATNDSGEQSSPGPPSKRRRLSGITQPPPTPRSVSPPTNDPLVGAIELLDRINRAVSTYDTALRDRAATILVERAFGRGTSPPSTIGPAGNPQNKSGFSGSSGDFASLVERWNPSSQQHWALLAAYFQTRFQGKETTTGQEINAILKHHGTVIRNITDALGANMLAKPALILQVAKSGSSRQARKTYKVTTQGIQYVERMLQGTSDSEK
jgi:hypothetical protein